MAPVKSQMAASQPHPPYTAGVQRAKVQSAYALDARDMGQTDQEPFKNTMSTLRTAEIDIRDD